MAHAVQDDTMLKKYIPHVRRFLHFAAQRGATFDTDAEIDREMTIFLERGL